MKHFQIHRKLKRTQRTLCLGKQQCLTKETWADRQYALCPQLKQPDSTVRGQGGPHDILSSCIGMGGQLKLARPMPASWTWPTRTLEAGSSCAPPKAGLPSVRAMRWREHCGAGRCPVCQSPSPDAFFPKSRRCRCPVLAKPTSLRYLSWHPTPPFSG